MTIRSTGFLGLSYEPRPREVANVVNGLILGRTNNLGEFTIAAGAATTIVSDPRIGLKTCVALMPITSSAGSERPWVTAVSTGVFTINHTNSTQSDRNFVYAVIGG